MDEEYWKGQVDAKLDFIKEEMAQAKHTLITNTAKNDTDHETIKNQISTLKTDITTLKAKTTILGALAGGVGAGMTFLGKYLLGK